MGQQERKLAIVTGASSGIGLELARLAAAQGYDLVIAADEPEIHNVKAALARPGVYVESVEADLSTFEGVDQLCAAAQATGREVDALIANAGRGLGGAFLDQEPARWRKVVDTNVNGSLYLIHRVPTNSARATPAASSSPALSPASCRARSRLFTTAPKRSSTPFAARCATS